MTFLDITGQKFGKLLVVSRAPNNERGSATWNCLCDCGKNRLVETARLKDGKIWNCGCENKTPTPLIDMIGKRFGKLTVIFRVMGQRSTKYSCLCDCGKSLIAFATGLRRGTTKSCPSCKVSPRLIDITGQKFGKLTILRRFFPQKSSEVVWECLCDCGNKIVVQKGQLNKESSCGCSRKKSFNTNANFSDLTGQRFGKITVISRVDGGARWNCHCDCGKDLEYYHSHLVNDKFTSCGCAFIKPYEDQTLSSQHSLYEGYRKNASYRKISFDLNFDQFIEFTKGDCFYCGVKPMQHFKAACALKGYIYNGLDRLDNSKGYCMSNVVSCCKTCNKAKWTMDKDPFIAWIKRGHEHSIRPILKLIKYNQDKEWGTKFIYGAYERLCAKKRGLSFLLKYEEFSSLIQQDCYYCGIPPQNFLNLKNKQFYYSGLDRVNNRIGYELLNVVPCCKFCNIAKGTKTPEEFSNWLKKCYYHLNLGMSSVNAAYM